jgi:hypothetical protein
MEAEFQWSNQFFSKHTVSSMLLSLGLVAQSVKQRIESKFSVISPKCKAPELAL